MDGREARADPGPFLFDLEAKSGDLLFGRRVLFSLELFDLLLELDDGLFQGIKVDV